MINSWMACLRRGQAPSLPATWPPCALALGWRSRCAPQPRSAQLRACCGAGSVNRPHDMRAVVVIAGGWSELVDRDAAVVVDLAGQPGQVRRLVRHVPI